MIVVQRVGCVSNVVKATQMSLQMIKFDNLSKHWLLKAKPEFARASTSKFGGVPKISELPLPINGLREIIRWHNFCLEWNVPLYKCRFFFRCTLQLKLEPILWHWFVEEFSLVLLHLVVFWACMPRLMRSSNRNKWNQRLHRPTRRVELLFLFTNGLEVCRSHWLAVLNIYLIWNFSIITVWPGSSSWRWPYW